MSASKTSRVITLTLDERSLTLTVNDQVIPIRPSYFRLLLLLARKRMADAESILQEIEKGWVSLAGISTVWPDVTHPQKQITKVRQFLQRSLPAYPPLIMTGRYGLQSYRLAIPGSSIHILEAPSIATEILRPYVEILIHDIREQLDQGQGSLQPLVRGERATGTRVRFTPGVEESWQKAFQTEDYQEALISLKGIERECLRYSSGSLLDLVRAYAALCLAAKGDYYAAREQLRSVSGEMPRLGWINLLDGLIHLFLGEKEKGRVLLSRVKGKYSGSSKRLLRQTITVPPRTLVMGWGVFKLARFDRDESYRLRPIRTKPDQ